MNPNPCAPLAEHALAVRAERIDTDNWIDDFEAASPHVDAALGLGATRQGELAMVRSRIPFSHFNMVLTLGCPAAADRATFGTIDRFYADGGAGRHWVLFTDHSRPRDLERHLLARGYAPGGAWERVVCQTVPADRWASQAQGCEFVTAANQAEWSGCLLGCYGMPPLTADWLHALVGRRGWMHAIRRDGAVVMASSFYQGGDGWAGLGIDAPVPGVMAPCLEDDQRVTATLLAAAAAQGAQAFVGDIELPSSARDGEAYQRWAELGFSPVYLRKLYVKR
jgi:hypothetical protein